MICEFDNELKVFTCYSGSIPQIYGEGTTEEEAIENMIDEAIEFLDDYKDNVSLYSSIFDENQKQILNRLLLHSMDRKRLKEILKDI